MAKKTAKMGKGHSQKLGTGNGVVTNLGVRSMMEPAANVAYKGYSQNPVRHGEMGVLSGKGQKKSAKIPQG